MVREGEITLNEDQRLCLGSYEEINSLHIYAHTRHTNTHTHALTHTGGKTASDWYNRGCRSIEQRREMVREGEIALNPDQRLCLGDYEEINSLCHPRAYTHTHTHAHTQGTRPRLTGTTGGAAALSTCGRSSGRGRLR